jgi:hypothetical protein
MNTRAAVGKCEYITGKALKQQSDKVLFESVTELLQLFARSWKLEYGLWRMVLDVSRKVANVRMDSAKLLNSPTLRPYGPLLPNYRSARLSI